MRSFRPNLACPCHSRVPLINNGDEWWKRAVRHGIEDAESSLALPRQSRLTARAQDYADGAGDPLEYWVRQNAVSSTTVYSTASEQSLTRLRNSFPRPSDNRFELRVPATLFASPFVGEGLYRVAEDVYVMPYSNVEDSNALRGSLRAVFQ